MNEHNVISIDQRRAGTLPALVERYLASKARLLGNKSDKTLRAYRQDLGRFLSAFGGKAVDQVEGTLLERYLRGLTRPDGSPVSPSTANRHQATLSSFFTWLTDQGVLAANPMKGVRKARTVEPEAGALAPAVRDRLLVQAKRAGTREHLLVLLLLTTGLRISEALALDLADVHLEDLSITVRAGKGNKRRRVFITPEVRQVVKRLIRERNEHEIRAPLFQSNRGRLSYQRAASLFKAIAGELRNHDGSPLHLHQLRHSFCSEQLAKGMNPVHLMTISGHTDLRTLGRYTKAAREAAAEDDFRRYNR